MTEEKDKKHKKVEEKKEEQAEPKPEKKEETPKEKPEKKVGEGEEPKEKPEKKVEGGEKPKESKDDFRHRVRVLRELVQEMEELSREERFEDAAIVRNRIAALSEVPGKKMRDYSGWGDVAVKLKRLLRLSRLPLRIEAFDVSNIQGKEATGSMVYFCNGRPDKSNYSRINFGKDSIW
ncbi:MAG: UvrB/UvrC motif-containing protein [Candidatus Altiarchaeota archaeon]|nr:UvrB/UvrC motif-containing protein [Candidatus Altiarchaeota archaeon]